MKSNELKKCEAKLNELYKQIKSKESIKIEQETNFAKKKTLMRSLSSQIRSSAVNRQEISRELDSLKNQRDVLHADMNRIKADLLYKTKAEYEEMIKRFENELEKNNSRKYCPSEERRLLNEIKMHKSGLKLLESYEDLKKSYDRLNEAWKEKKQKLDEVWNLDRVYREQISNMNEECKKLTNLIADINLELEELNNKKVELKKLVEDLNRENVHKQQIARKNLLEKNSKKQKEDEVESSMESALREYNKLITYFHKLSSQDDSDACNTPTAATGKMGWIQNSPSVENMLSTYSSSSFADKQPAPVLFESADENKNDYSGNSGGECDAADNQRQDQACASRLEPPRTLKIPTLATVKSEPLLSPSFFNTPDEPAGSFIMKKKFDDDFAGNRWANNPNRKRHNKKSKNSKVKISHSVEVINLLSKLNIPIHLSSQIDECLKVLYANRDDLQNQLNLYKQNRRDKQSIENKKSPKVQDEFELSAGASSSMGNVNESPKSGECSSRAHNTNDDTKLLQLLDNQSDISSNMDSNYESDNNSINLNLHDSTSATTVPSFSLNSDSLEHDAESKQPPQIKEFTLMKQKTQTSSDESDVTLTECPPGIELLYKKGKSTNSNSSSSNSDNTITPASPKTPTPANPFNNLDTLTLDDDDEKESASPKSTASTITTSLDPKRKISRQISDISDGYSSSATPLSASSINNEQPTINPFFPSSNK